MTDLTSVQIQALVREMDASMRKYRLTKRVNPEKYHELIAYENQTLYESFPTVFEMHIEGKLDATFFEMLKLKHKMEKKELTEDEASRIIGQKLFDRFVAPVIENKPVEKPMSYTEFYKQFSDK
jgi:uncharacterized short protein YbdD (DUF466 family)